MASSGSAGNGPTPTSPQRKVPAAPDSTKAPKPVHNPGHPQMSMSKHTRTPAVMGPAAWEMARDPVFTPKGTPPLKNTSPASMRPHSDASVTTTVGMNPNPPANRQTSGQAATTPRSESGLSWQPFATGQS